MRFLIGVLCLLHFSVGSCDDTQPRSLLVGGTATTGDDYPWIVAFQKKNVTSGTEKFRCPGSLIHTGDPAGTAVVLTSRYCASQLSVLPTEWTVFADIGRTDADDPLETGYQRFEILDYILYPKDSTHTSVDHNIALVVLDGAVTGVTPVNLVTQPTTFEDGTVMRVLSYGYTAPRNAGGTLADTLEFIDTAFVDISYCRQYPQWGPYVNIGMMCQTVDDVVGGCNGDAGGPILHGTDKTDAQAAIVSWGSPSCNPVAPMVSTDVGYYYGWIEHTISEIGGLAMPECEFLDVEGDDSCREYCLEIKEVYCNEAGTEVKVGCGLLLDKCKQRCEDYFQTGVCIQGVYVWY